MSAPSGPAPPMRLDRRTFGVAAAVVAVAALGLAAASMPDVSRLREAWPDTTSYMQLRLRQAEGAGRELTLRYDPVPLGRIPESVRRAVLVSEDAAFYGHFGIDLHEVRAAVAEAWRAKRLPRGASTITQQLARNLCLSPDRTLSRKLLEALIALRLEAGLSKHRILELYLNVIEFGDGLFGVQAASIRYFGLPVERLSPRQSAELAATIPSPRSDNPATRTGEFLWRADLAYRRAFEGDSAAASGARAAIASPADGRRRPETLPAGEAVAADTEPTVLPDTAAATARDTAAATASDTTPP